MKHCYVLTLGYIPDLMKDPEAEQEISSCPVTLPNGEVVQTGEAMAISVQKGSDIAVGKYNTPAADIHKVPKEWVPKVANPERPAEGEYPSTEEVVAVLKSLYGDRRNRGLKTGEIRPWGYVPVLV